MTRPVPPPPRGPLPPPPPAPRATNSLADAIIDVGRAYDTVTRSRRARPAVLWLIGILGAGASGSLGWVASKVDTLADMRAIRSDLLAIRTAQEKAAKAVADLTRDEDGKPPGRLLRLERGERYVVRAALEARTMAIAGEPEKARAHKLAEAARLGESYDKRLRSAEPLAAYDEVVERVAVK